MGRTVSQRLTGCSLLFGRTGCEPSRLAKFAQLGALPSLFLNSFGSFVSTLRFFDLLVVIFDTFGSSGGDFMF